eukprot:Amastigsp_a178774_199.p4 type:complete len:107 gc:universal Amastigsp_a178774_199:628-308(-)
MSPALNAESKRARSSSRRFEKTALILSTSSRVCASAIDSRASMTSFRSSTSWSVLSSGIMLNPWAWRSASARSTGSLRVAYDVLTSDERRCATSRSSLERWAKRSG